jgi:hypothetical protein
MKQYAEHGKVGVCHALRSDDMYSRMFAGGYPYIKDDVLVRSSVGGPIYSYGKNYEKNDEKFALFMWTTESDSSKVEETFTQALNNVKEEQITTVLSGGSFSYIDLK